MTENKINKKDGQYKFEKKIAIHYFQLEIFFFIISATFIDYKYYSDELQNRLKAFFIDHTAFLPFVPLPTKMTMLLKNKKLLCHVTGTLHFLIIVRLKARPIFILNTFSVVEHQTIYFQSSGTFRYS